jgi:hypothetical protein
MVNVYIINPATVHTVITTFHYQEYLDIMTIVLIAQYNYGQGKIK